jgi:hypothetical protein
MSRNTSGIHVSVTDTAVNAILEAPARPALPDTNFVCHFNQNEDQFINLEIPMYVPALPVHHRMDNPLPPEGYVDIIASLAQFLMNARPDLVAGTKWYFDPVSIHTPAFYRVIECEGRPYLYHIMIDLMCHPLECTITSEGSNNRTHAYRSDRLYFESNFYPLMQDYATSQKPGFLPLNQTIPFTWKGEAGEGYMIHGIWMDADINKFFSKLILPAGKRNHPYYPVTCKQHCVAMNAFGQDSPVLLNRIRDFIEPSLDQILEDLQTTAFSETMPLFRDLKNSIPAELGERWKSLSVKTLLNEREQKEYIIEF